MAPNRAVPIRLPWRNLCGPPDQLWRVIVAWILAAFALVVAGFFLQRERAGVRRAVALSAQRAELSTGKLRAKTAQLEAILGGIPDGVMMVDADLRLVEWNALFPDLAGVPKEILRVGLRMEDILRAQAQAGEVGEVDVEQEVSRRMALLRSGGSLGTIERTRPGGLTLELRRRPLPGGGFVTLYTDTTARHQAEEQLR